jgi:hypothetical protein
MGVRIGREPDGTVSVTITAGSETQRITLSAIEARLVAIKLLLAAESLAPSGAMAD